MSNRTLKAFGLLAALTGLGAATPAMAYIGPGAGLTAIGAFLAFAAAVIVAVIAFIWLPIRRRLRKMNAKSDVAADDALDDGE